MQREICRVRRVRPVDAAWSILILRAEQMSDRVLEMGRLHATTSAGLR